MSYPAAEPVNLQDALLYVWLAKQLQDSQKVGRTPLQDRTNQPPQRQNLHCDHDTALWGSHHIQQPIWK